MARRRAWLVAGHRAALAKGAVRMRSALISGPSIGAALDTGSRYNALSQRGVFVAMRRRQRRGRVAGLDS